MRSTTSFATLVLFRLEEDSTRGVLSEMLSEVLSEMLKAEKS